MLYILTQIYVTNVRYHSSTGPIFVYVIALSPSLRLLFSAFHSVYQSRVILGQTHQLTFALLKLDRTFVKQVSQLQVLLFQILSNEGLFFCQALVVFGIKFNFLQNSVFLVS